MLSRIEQRLMMRDFEVLAVTCPVLIYWELGSPAVGESVSGIAKVNM